MRFSLPGQETARGSEGRDAFGRTASEQNASGVHVLYGAFRLLCANRWCPARAKDLSVLGNEPPPPGLTLLDALYGANQDETGMAVEYARRLLRKLEWNFNDWENHPFRMAQEVLHLLRKAIVLGGGNAPPMPRLSDVLAAPRRRGGWVVTS